MTDYQSRFRSRPYTTQPGGDPNMDNVFEKSVSTLNVTPTNPINLTQNNPSPPLNLNLTPEQKQKRLVMERQATHLVQPNLVRSNIMDDNSNPEPEYQEPPVGNMFRKPPAPQFVKPVPGGGAYTNQQPPPVQYGNQPPQGPGYGYPPNMPPNGMPQRPRSPRTVKKPSMGGASPRMLAPRSMLVGTPGRQPQAGIPPNGLRYVHLKPGEVAIPATAGQQVPDLNTSNMMYSAQPSLLLDQSVNTGQPGYILQQQQVLPIQQQVQTVYQAQPQIVAKGKKIPAPYGLKNYLYYFYWCCAYNRLKARPFLKLMTINVIIIAILTLPLAAVSFMVPDFTPTGVTLTGTSVVTTPLPKAFVYLAVPLTFLSILAIVMGLLTSLQLSNRKAKPSGLINAFGAYLVLYHVLAFLLITVIFALLVINAIVMFVFVGRIDATAFTNFRNYIRNWGIGYGLAAAGVFIVWLLHLSQFCLFGTYFRAAKEISQRGLLRGKRVLA